MRPLLVLLLLLPLASIAQAGGTTGCVIIPHVNSIAAVDDCAVQLTTAPGIMIVEVESVTGNFGVVEIDGFGPSNSRVEIQCALAGTAASCVRSLELVGAPGIWRFTARAQASNPSTFDEYTAMRITYP